MLRTIKRRRNTPGCFLNIVHEMKLALLIGLSFLLTDLAQANNDYNTDIESQVRNAAIAHLAAQNRDTEIDIFVNPVNPALALEPCSQPLDVRFPYTSNQRLTARVSCSGSKNWSIFVTARVAFWKQVVVAAEPISRGTQINVNQLTLGRVDTTRKGDQYFSQINQVSGQRARRAIGADQPVEIGDLEPALLVKRGEQVTLEASRGGVQIRVMAIALEDGSLGEQIRVQNQQSKRELLAEVIDSGRVRIN